MKSPTQVSPNAEGGNAPVKEQRTSWMTTGGVVFAFAALAVAGYLIASTTGTSTSNDAAINVETSTITGEGSLNVEASIQAAQAEGRRSLSEGRSLAQIGDEDVSAVTLFAVSADNDYEFELMHVGGSWFMVATLAIGSYDISAYGYGVGSDGVYGELFRGFANDQVISVSDRTTINLMLYQSSSFTEDEQGNALPVVISQGVLPARPDTLVAGGDSGFVEIATIDPDFLVNDDVSIKLELDADFGNDHTVYYDSPNGAILLSGNGVSPWFSPTTLFNAGSEDAALGQDGWGKFTQMLYVAAGDDACSITSTFRVHVEYYITDDDVSQGNPDENKVIGPYNTDFDVVCNEGDGVFDLEFDTPPEVTAVDVVTGGMSAQDDTPNGEALWHDYNIEGATFDEESDDHTLTWTYTCTETDLATGSESAIYPVDEVASTSVVYQNGDVAAQTFVGYVAIDHSICTPGATCNCAIDIAPTQDSFDWAEWADDQNLEDPLNNGLVNIAFTSCAYNAEIGGCVELDHSPLLSDSVQFGEFVADSVSRVHGYSSYGVDMQCEVSVVYYAYGSYHTVTLGHGQSSNANGVYVLAETLTGSTSDDLTVWTTTDSAVCSGASVGWQITFQADDDVQLGSYTVSLMNVNGETTGKTFADYNDCSCQSTPEGGYSFMFNGCPRGVAYYNWWSLYSYSATKQQCMDACDNDYYCRAIEINGCLGDEDCNGYCWLFYDWWDSYSMYNVWNGYCDTSGNQKAYYKVDPDHYMWNNWATSEDLPWYGVTAYGGGCTDINDQYSCSTWEPRGFWQADGEGAFCSYTCEEGNLLAPNSDGSSGEAPANTP